MKKKKNRAKTCRSEIVDKLISENSPIAFQKNKIPVLCQKALLLVWILVTCAAVIGMYRLWWQRERVLYWGKDVATQRVKVLEGAGISSSILEKFREIDSSWPMGIEYQTSGDHNQLSYLKYLLIPRIPGKSLDYQIQIRGDTIEYDGLSSKNRPERNYSEKPKFYGFFLSILFILGTGFLIRSARRLRSLNLSESMGVSCLILMILALISIGVFNRTTHGFVLFGIWSISGWGFFFFKKYKGNQLSIKYCSTRYEKILIALGLTIFLWAMLMAVVVVPDDWDAWAIWGSKAKVMALANGPLQNVTYFDHQDYPLLWPVVWAFSGLCAGGWEEHWSRGWGPLFMLLTAWQIYFIIKRETDRTDIAITGAVMFLSIPMVPLVASWSYAEPPLWLMMTCSFGYVLRWRKERSTMDLFLSAFFAVAAAYTKNEGALFALLVFFWILITSLKDWKKAIAFYFIPFLVLYLPWVYWIRFILKMTSHATIGITMSRESIWAAINRVPETLSLIGKIWMDIKQWNIVLWFIGISLAVTLFKGGKNERIDLMLSISLLLGYLIVTLFHFNSPGYQVGSSWNRLTLHAVPLMIITIMGGQRKWHSAE